jgi:hypothetical protein
MIIKNMIDGAGSYSNHLLKSKNVLNFLSNSNNYKKQKDFHLLMPAYDIGSREIVELIKSIIMKEYKIG